MGKHGATARFAQPCDDLGQHRPLDTHIRRPPALQEQTKRLPGGPRMPALHQPLRKMAAPDGGMPPKQVMRAGHPERRQPIGDRHPARPADGPQPAQPPHEPVVIDTQIKAYDMNGMPFPRGGYFDTRNQRHIVHRRCRTRGDHALDCVMIGDGENAHPGRGGSPDQGLWRQLSIRTDCVRMQIVVHFPSPFLWTKGSMTAIAPLAEVPAHMARIRRSLLAVAPPAGTRRPDDDIEALLHATQEFTDLLIRLDGRYGAQGALPDDASQLGDTGLGTFAELASRANALGLPHVQAELERVTVSIADWVARHQGKIGVLEPVVNGLALIANDSQDQAALGELADFMNHLANAVSDTLRSDTDKSNSGRPWRILNLNCAIVATRSHDVARMTQVFDQLVQRLPEDAAAFFREGMRQMEVIDYPPQVRAVMQHYFQAFAQHTLH